jgi:peptide/nickel transport system substrate-binding protein
MRRAMLFIAAAAFAFGGANAFTLTVGMTQDIGTLDPHGVNDLYSSQVRRQVYDTLVEQAEDFEFQPGLAERWTQIDDLTWEFALRPGVTFHNGDTLTASDVKFTLDRLRDPATASPSAFLVGFIDEVEVVDELTVRVVTEYPFAPIVAHLSHTSTSILNERAVNEAGEDYGTEVVVGTGPFEFVLWEVASRIVLERNDDWWGGEVLPERVVFRPITEGTVRAIELEAGAIDIAYRLDPRDALRLQDHDEITLAPVQTLSTTYVGFHTQKAPFDDARVRQAINQAVDITTIVDVVYEGFGVAASGPIGPGVFGYNPDLEPYTYDPERARELLAEAGYGDGFSASIWVAEQPPRIQIAEIMQAQLGEIGIDIDIQVMEFSTYLADTAAGAHQMFILGWSTPTGDADYGLFALFHSSTHGGAGNRTFYSNERVDELLDLGRREGDPERRVAIYHELQELIRDEAPWLFLNTITENPAFRSNVTGFQPHPTENHRLWNVNKD